MSRIMSCNGCRVLRKGCGDKCMLAQCLRCIDGPKAQGHATLFVAKFFGRATLFSFLSRVPLSHRPSLFRSLLFEAAGRTISPVNGAVGLLLSRNWQLCQAAVDTVLRGGTIHALPEAPIQGDSGQDSDDGSQAEDNYCSGPATKRKKVNNEDDVEPKRQRTNLELSLSSGSTSSSGSEESETTMLGSVSMDDQSETRAGERKLLRLFF